MRGTDNVLINDATAKEFFFFGLMSYDYKKVDNKGHLWFHGVLVPVWLMGKYEGVIIIVVLRFWEKLLSWKTKHSMCFPVCVGELDINSPEIPYFPFLCPTQELLCSSNGDVQSVMDIWTHVLSTLRDGSGCKDSSPGVQVYWRGNWWDKAAFLILFLDDKVTQFRQLRKTTS